MVSVKGLSMAVALIAMYVLATHTSAAHPGCCLNYMKSRIPFGIIKGYSLQKTTELCPINAIIFHTDIGKACTNPDLPWVTSYIQRLSKRARNLRNASQKQKERSSPF